jgi:hypothetical protein
MAATQTVGWIRSHGRKATGFALFALVLLTALAVASSSKAAVESPPPPSVWSDKADYAPGELVTLSGANWAPGEAVHIRVNDDAGETWRRDVDVTADESGAISDQFNLPDSFVATYNVTATGATSGTATWSFTDGTIRFELATADNAAPAGFTWSVDWQVFNGTGSSPNSNCSPPVANSGTANLTGNTLSGGTNPGGNQNDSAKPVSVSVTGTFAQQYIFAYWSDTAGGTTPSATVCKQGLSGGGNFTTLYAHFKPQLRFQLATAGNDANGVAGFTWSVDWQFRANTNCTGSPGASDTASYIVNALTGGNQPMLSTTQGVMPTSANAVGSFSSYSFQYWSSTATSTTPLSGSALCKAWNGGAGGAVTLFAHFSSVQTTSVGGVSATGSTYGGTTNLSATVSPANAPGSVAFYVNGSTTAASGTVNYTQSTGVATLSNYAHGLDASPTAYSVRAVFTSTSGSFSNSEATNSAALTVGKADQAALSVTSPDDGTYGDKLVPTASGGSGTGALSFTAAGSACEMGSGADSGKLVITSGTGTCSVTAHKATDTNYNAADSAAHAVTVHKAQLTVEAQNKSKNYDGNAFTAFTSAITGFKFGDSESVVSGSVTYGGAAVGAVDAGSYAIVPGISGLSADNYTFTASNGTLTILRVTLTVRADNKSKVFDNSPFTAFTRTITGFVNSESESVISGTVTYAGSAVGATAVGTYTISPVVSGLSATNYNFTPANGTLTIGAWNAQGYGFYQPVGADAAHSIFTAAPASALTSKPASMEWNTAKGGSTIPLKFNVYAGTVEKTSLTDTFGAVPFQATKLNSCTDSINEDPVDFTTTGNTSLRYDGTAGQWIQNWKTPSANTETCYRAWVTFADGSSIEAFFKLKR